MSKFTVLFQGAFHYGFNQEILENITRGINELQRLLPADLGLQKQAELVARFINKPGEIQQLFGHEDIQATGCNQKIIEQILTQLKDAKIITAQAKIHVFDLSLANPQIFSALRINGNEVYVAKWLVDMLEENALDFAFAVRHEITERNIYTTYQSSLKELMTSDAKLAQFVFLIDRNGEQFKGIFTQNNVAAILREIRAQANLTEAEKISEFAHRLALLEIPIPTANIAAFLTRYRMKQFQVAILRKLELELKLNRLEISIATRSLILTELEKGASVDAVYQRLSLMFRNIQLLKAQGIEINEELYYTRYVAHPKISGAELVHQGEKFTIDETFVEKEHLLLLYQVGPEANSVYYIYDVDLGANVLGPVDACRITSCAGKHYAVHHDRWLSGFHLYDLINRRELLEKVKSFDNFHEYLNCGYVQITTKEGKHSLYALDTQECILDCVDNLQWMECSGMVYIHYTRGEQKNLYSLAEGHDVLSAVELHGDQYVKAKEGEHYYLFGLAGGVHKVLPEPINYVVNVYVYPQHHFMLYYLDAEQKRFNLYSIKSGNYVVRNGTLPKAINCTERVYLTYALADQPTIRRIYELTEDKSFLDSDRTDSAGITLYTYIDQDTRQPKHLIRYTKFEQKRHSLLDLEQRVDVLELDPQDSVANYFEQNVVHHQYYVLSKIQDGYRLCDITTKAIVEFPANMSDHSYTQVHKIGSQTLVVYQKGVYSSGNYKACELVYNATAKKVLQDSEWASWLSFQKQLTNVPRREAIPGLDGFFIETTYVEGMEHTVFNRGAKLLSLKARDSYGRPSFHKFKDGFYVLYEDNRRYKLQAYFDHTAWSEITSYATIATQEYDNVLYVWPGYALGRTMQPEILSILQANTEEKVSYNMITGCKKPYLLKYVNGSCVMYDMVDAKTIVAGLIMGVAVCYGHPYAVVRKDISASDRAVIGNVYGLYDIEAEQWLIEDSKEPMEVSGCGVRLRGNWLDINPYLPKEPAKPENIESSFEHNGVSYIVYKTSRGNRYVSDLVAKRDIIGPAQELTFHRLFYQKKQVLKPQQRTARFEGPGYSIIDSHCLPNPPDLAKYREVIISTYSQLPAGATARRMYLSNLLHALEVPFLLEVFAESATHTLLANTAFDDFKPPKPTIAVTEPLVEQKLVITAPPPSAPPLSAVTAVTTAVVAAAVPANQGIRAKLQETVANQKKSVAAKIEELRQKKLDLESLKQCAVLCLELQNYESALQAAEQAMEQVSELNDIAIINAVIAKAQFSLGNVAAALEAGKVVLEIDFRNFATCILLSEIYITTKDFAAANEYVVRILDYIPTNTPEAVKAFALLQIIALKSKNIRKALEYGKNAQSSFAEYLKFSDKKLSSQLQQLPADKMLKGEDIALYLLLTLQNLNLTYLDQTLISHFARISIDYLVEVTLQEMLRRKYDVINIRQTLLTVLGSLTDIEGSGVLLIDEWARQFGIEAKRVYTNIDTILQKAGIALEAASSSSATAANQHGFFAVSKEGADPNHAAQSGVAFGAKSL